MDISAQFDALIPADVSLTTAHAKAIEEANAWRGRCVNHFARGEFVVAKALLRAEGKLPMLLRPRLARLQVLHAGNEKRCEVIQQFDALLKWRNAMVHGAGKLWIDRDGAWLLTLQHVERNEVADVNVRQRDAQQLAKDIKAVVERLASKLAA